jgi:prepilin-type N-terminal cleavage/methylation domain-containing protein
MIKTNNSKFRKGFSLIEVLVALTIFGFCTIAVMGYFVYADKANRISKDTTIATNLAQSLLDDRLNVPYNNLLVQSGAKTNYSGDSTNPYYRFFKKIDVSLIDSNLQASANDVGLKKIDVYLSWQEGSSERSVQLSTIKARR